MEQKIWVELWFSAIAGGVLFAITRPTGKILEQTELALDRISDVQVERADSSEGGWTYRVNFNLKSGLGLPLTKYYTSGFDDKQ